MYKGQVLAERYEIIEYVGGGGMSIVYKAKDVLLDRIIAVKILKEQFVNDEAFVKRFRREAKSVAGLSHPNIVNIYDVGNEGEVHFLVMEYVEGKTLKQLIDQGDYFSIRRALVVTEKILSALKHAHSNFIVHRDIKPHNIIISSEGMVKVMDFGLAQAVSSSTVTFAKGVMGSIHYISPEQAKGLTTDKRTDIYSLGIVLYEMLTGRVPFEGENPIGIAMQHIQRKPIPPSKINGDIDPEIEDLIMNALAKNASDRYRDTEEMRMVIISILMKTDDEHRYNKTIKYPEKKENETEIGNQEHDIEETKLYKNNSVNPESKKRNSQKRILLLALAVVLAVFFLIIRALGVNTEVRVPDLKGKPLAEAKEIVEKTGLVFELEREIVDREYEPGTIISQNPQAELATKKGRTVRVVASAARGQVEVPNLFDYSRIMADVLLSNNDLIIGKIDYDFSDEVEEGKIARQEPQAGTLTSAGTPINIVISKGNNPSSVQIPNIISMKIEEAEEVMLAQGFEFVILVREESKTEWLDTIISQNPLPGRFAPPGEKIYVTVSLGPGPEQGFKTVQARLPEAGMVRIDVEDKKGWRKVYEDYHNRGEFFSQSVGYYGKGTITILINEKAILREDVP